MTVVPLPPPPPPVVPGPVPPPVDVDCPPVPGLHRIVIHARRPFLALDYDEDLDPARAGNLASYRLRTPGRDRRFGTRDDRRVRIRSATVSPGARTVIVRTGRRLPLRLTYELSITETASCPADRDGNPPDGGSDVDATVVFGGLGPSLRRRLSHPRRGPNPWSRYDTLSHGIFLQYRSW